MTDRSRLDHCGWTGTRGSPPACSGGLAAAAALLLAAFCWQSACAQDGGAPLLGTKRKVQPPLDVALGGHPMGFSQPGHGLIARHADVDVVKRNALAGNDHAPGHDNHTEQQKEKFHAANVWQTARIVNA